MTVKDIQGTRGGLLKKKNENDDSHLPRQVDLLFARTGSKSTDPRDKVYGLLGVTRNPTALIVDYRKSVAEVYMATTRAMIAESQNLQALNAIQRSGEDNDLPS
jgi:hypothetical protein